MMSMGSTSQIGCVSEPAIKAPPPPSRSMYIRRAADPEDGADGYCTWLFCWRPVP